MSRRGWVVLILGLLALPVGGCVGLRIWVDQAFLDPYLCEVRSPVDPASAFWLCEGGFQDRGIELFARDRASGEARRVATLDWPGLYYFQDARWSRDGKVVAINLNLAKPNHPTVVGFAFDFAAGRELLPSKGSVAWDMGLDAWRDQEGKVQALVEAHGGPAGEPIDRTYFRAHARSVWTWEMPPR